MLPMPAHPLLSRRLSLQHQAAAPRLPACRALAAPTALELPVKRQRASEAHAPGPPLTASYSRLLILGGAEAKLQEKADGGDQEAAKLLVQWDERRNQELADGPPFWQHACPKCRAQHSWQARVDKRLRRGAALQASCKSALPQSELTVGCAAGYGCPFCAGQQTCGCSSLAMTHPDLAEQWTPRNGQLQPSQVSAGSEQRFWWQCPKRHCNHEWQARPNQRTRSPGATGCPECSRKRELYTSAPPADCLCCTLAPLTEPVRTGHPSLAEGRFQLAAEWHPTLNGNLTPADVTLGSNKRVWWLCSTGCPCKHDHIWSAAVSTRALLASGCPVCAGQRPCQCNSLSACHPQLVQQHWDQEANGQLQPEDLLPGSDRKVAWRCDLHESAVCWLATPHKMVKPPTGCPVCARNRTAPAGEA